MSSGAAAVEHRARHRPHDGIGHDVGGIGEAIQEVAALEAVGPSVCTMSRYVAVLDDADRLEASRVLIVFDAHHRAERQIGSAGFEVLAGGDGGGLQMEHRDAVDHRKDAAGAAEDAVARSRRRSRDGTSTRRVRAGPPQ